MPQRYAPPTGFVLDEDPAQPPAPPAQTQTDASRNPPPPVGFVMDSGSTNATPDAPQDDIFQGIKPATTGPELLSGLDALQQKGVPGSTLRAYMVQSHSRSSEAAIPKQTMDAIDQYDAAIAKGQKPRIAFRLTDPEPQTSAGGAAWAGLRSSATLGWDDEIQGVGGGIGATLGDALHGRFGDVFSGNSFSRGYNEEQQAARDNKQAAWDEHPYAYGAGYGAGIIPTLVLPGGRAVQGGNYLSNAGRLAATGAAYGATAGAGNADGSLADRARGGAIGGATGAVLGPVVQPVARVLGAPIVSALNRAGSYIPGTARNALNSGLDLLARRAPQDTDAMAARAAQYRGAGMEPSLTDVVDQGGRGVIRAMVPKSGPARQAAADAADAVYTDAQSRVGDVARRIITPGNDQSARNLAGQIQAERDAITGPAMDAVRGDAVPLTPELTQVLRTPEGQKALIAARGLMTPEERAPVDAVMNAIRTGKLQGGYPPEVQQAIDQIPPGLSPQARQSVITQITGGKPPDSGPTLTVDIADKLSRSLLGRANANVNPGLARVSGDMGRTVRDAARGASPGYGQVLDDYASRSRVGDAAAGTGRYEDNSTFIGRGATNPETFRATVQGAPTTAPPVQDGAVLPSEADAIRMRARDAVVDRSSNSPADAYRTAKDLAIGDAQGQRNNALVGPRGGAQLRDAAQAEADRFRNAGFVDERAGSKTAGVMGDQDLSNELFHVVAAGATGGKWPIVRQMTKMFGRMGVRGVDAERLTRDAISRDPDRIDSAIEYLAGRGVRRDQANSIVRSLASGVIGRTVGSYQQPDRTPFGAVVPQQ